MELAKLDIYNYIILPGIIRIQISGSNDPILVDILSEIESADGRIYVDGYYYMYLDNYDVCSRECKVPHIDIEVVELNRS